MTVWKVKILKLPEITAEERFQNWDSLRALSQIPTEGILHISPSDYGYTMKYCIFFSPSSSSPAFLVFPFLSPSPVFYSWPRWWTYFVESFCWALLPWHLPILHLGQLWSLLPLQLHCQGLPFHLHHHHPGLRLLKSSCLLEVLSLTQNLGVKKGTKKKSIRSSASSKDASLA